MPIYKVLKGVIPDDNGYSRGVGEIFPLNPFEAGRYLADGAIEEYNPMPVAPVEIVAPPFQENQTPDIGSMTAEDAIALIKGITPKDEPSAQLLANLLEAETLGKKRKTVISAIRETLAG